MVEGHERTWEETEGLPAGGDRRPGAVLIQRHFDELAATAAPRR
jgi:hypothetical protein